MYDQKKEERSKENDASDKKKDEVLTTVLKVKELTGLRLKNRRC